MKTYVLFLLMFAVNIAFAGENRNKLSGSDCSDALMTINGVSTDSTIHCVSDSLTFLDVSDADPLSSGQTVDEYVFVYGDGDRDSFTVASSSFKHKYATAGYYTTQIITMNLTPSACRDTMELVVRILPEITVNNDSTDESCSGAGDGEAKINITAGLAPFDIVWSRGGSTILSRTDTNTLVDSITSRTPGFDVYTITDSAGACSLTDSMRINAGITLAIDSIDTVQVINCQGDSTGAIRVVMDNGSANFRYEWDTTRLGNTLRNNTNEADTADTLTSLWADTYYVRITDGAGCQVDDSLVLGDGIPIVTSGSTPNAITCYGDSGSVRMSITSGGAANFRYQWSTIRGGVTVRDTTRAQTADNLTNIPTGWYYVTITDANGCAKEDSVELVTPDSIELTGAVVSGISCAGAQGAVSMTISAGAGNADYQYKWSKSQGGAAARDVTITPTSDTYSGIGAGLYWCIVTDNNGCSTEDTIRLNDGTSLEIVKDTVENIWCLDSTATVAVQINNGATPYHYEWSAIDTSNNELRDTVGKPALRDTLAGLQDSTTYYIKITDNNGCIISDTFYFQKGIELTLVDSISNALDCNGDTDGSVQVRIAGSEVGQANYTYDWSDSRTGPADQSQTNGTLTNTYSSLGADMYYVTVTDANGCQANDSINLTEPTAMVLTTVGDTAFCGNVDDGEATASVSGGTSPYTYIWSDVRLTGSRQTTTKAALTDTLIGLGLDTIYLRVDDANGCQVEDSSVIFQYAAITFADSIVNASCGTADGKAFIAVTGGAGDVSNFNYNWDGAGDVAGLDSIVNVAAGTYTVVVTDSVGCIDSVDANISNDNAPGIETFTITNVTCWSGTDGEIDITSDTGGTGTRVVSIDGITYGAGRTFTGLSAGNYNIYVRDDNGCIAIEDTTLTSPDTLIVTLAHDTATCGNDDANVYAIATTGGTSPYQYNWGAGNVVDTFDVAQHGGNDTVSVIVTDARACPVAVDTIVVLQDSSFVVGPSTTSITTDGSLPCVGLNEVYTIDSVVGIDSMRWLIPTNATGVTAVNDTFMTYTFDRYSFDDTISVIMMNACGTSDTLIRRVTTSDTFNVVFDNVSPYCEDSNGVASVNRVSTTGGYGSSSNWNYVWTGAVVNDSLIDVQAGTYTVTITDEEGCQYVESTTLTEDAVNFNPAHVPDPRWSIVGNQNFCPGATHVYIIDSVDFVDTYTWNTGMTGFTFNSAQGDTSMSIAWSTDYDQSDALWITLTNRCGASLDIQGAIAVQTVDSIDFSLVSDSSQCSFDNGWASVPPDSISGGAIGSPNDYTFNWSATSGGATLSTNDTLFNVGPGTYFVLVDDTAGCYVQEGSIVVELDTAFVDSGRSVQGIRFDDPDNVFCNGASGETGTFYTDSVVNVSTYNWSTSTNGSITVNPVSDTICDINFGTTAQTGFVYLEMINQCNGRLYDSVAIVINPMPQIPVDSIWPTTICVTGQNALEEFAVEVEQYATNYVWDVTGITGNIISNSGNQIFVDVNNSSAGNVSVYFETEYCGNSAPLILPVAIDIQPDASFTLNDQCVFDSTSLVATNFIAGGTWSVTGDPDIRISNLGELSHINLNTLDQGPIEIQVTYTLGTVQCTHAVPQTISIIPQDFARISVSGGAVICDNDEITVDLDASSVAGGVFNYVENGSYTDNHSTGATISTSTGEVFNTLAGVQYTIAYITPTNPGGISTFVPYGCPDTVQTILITESSIPSDTADLDVVAPVCTDGEIALIYNGNAGSLDSLIWSVNGEITRVDFVAGDTLFVLDGQNGLNTVTLTTKDASGCTDQSQSVEFNLFGELPVNISVYDDSLYCLGVPSIFHRDPAEGYTVDSLDWDIDDEAFTDTTILDTNFSHIYTTTGEKEVSIIVYSQGCIGEASLTVDINDVEIAGIPNDTFQLGRTVKWGTEIIIPNSAQSSEFDHTWTPDFGLSDDDSHDPRFTASSDFGEEGKEYQVIVVDPTTGCADTTSFMVWVNQKKNLFIPTTFSPNGDGKNELFVYYGDGICPDQRGDIRMEIFNRWGEKVWEGSNEFWDGNNLEGIPQPIDTYVYLLYFQYCDGSEPEQYPMVGTITLIR